MANCICCGDKVCTRRVPFSPDLGGFLCFNCETNDEFIQRRKEEIEFFEKQNS